MRLMITGGGTGGHVYPALSVLEAFNPEPELLWVGKADGLEGPIVQRAGIPYQSIRAGGLADLSWTTRLRNSLLLLRGFGEAWGIVRRFNPEVVLATGGYVTFPVGLAAWLQRVPIAVYLPDISPGLAVRALAPLATKVAVTTAETARRFGSKGVVTGYPVRQGLANPKSKKEARESFSIPSGDRVLLVTGGSQGSHSLNQAIGNDPGQFLKLAHVIHVHGKSDREWLSEQREALPAKLRERYQLFDYLHERMIDALLAADLVVARAGASVLGEFTAAALPAVLVPFPAPGVKQEDNARWLEAKGGAVVLPDEKAGDQLLPVVRSILMDGSRLAAMEQAMRTAAHPAAAANIVTMLRTLSSHTERPTKHEAETSYDRANH